MRASKFAAAVFAFLLCSNRAFAQLPPLDPPLAGRPTNFSQLIGRFTIEATVEPSAAIVEDPITLRITIKGDVAAGEPPTRKHLRIFPDGFAGSFYLEPVSAQDKLDPDAKTWEFVWKLRPKSTDVRELPSLALVAYSPLGNIGDKTETRQQVWRYQTFRSEPIALTINARPKAVADESEPRSAPESFLELAAQSPWQAPSRLPTIGVAGWIGLAMILGALSWQCGGILARRTAAQRLAQRAQVSADAVAVLQQGPADLAAVLTRYLQVRFGLAATEPSPAEIRAVLKRNDVSATDRECWMAWYRAVAARRFAPATADQSSDHTLTNEAIALIQSMEAKT